MLIGSHVALDARSAILRAYKIAILHPSIETLSGCWRRFYSRRLERLEMLDFISCLLSAPCQVISSVFDKIVG